MPDRDASAPPGWNTQQRWKVAYVGQAVLGKGMFLWLGIRAAAESLRQLHHRDDCTHCMHLLTNCHPWLNILFMSCG